MQLKQLKPTKANEINENTGNQQKLNIGYCKGKKTYASIIHNMTYILPYNP